MQRLAVWCAVAVLAGTVAACGGDEGIPADLSGFSTTDDPRVTVVTYTTGHCDEVSPPAVAETNDEVRVTVMVRIAPHDQRCSTIAPLVHRDRVALQQELGSRRVRGGQQGPDAQRIPLTPSPWARSRVPAARNASPGLSKSPASTSSPTSETPTTACRE
jgi:hypothetical protein